MKEKIILTPIGYLYSELNWRYETPRQGVLAENIISVIKLEPGNNFEQAVKDLEGFDRLWIIYIFHLNKNWKPLVTPPRHTRKKIGVFATRAPYRPNHIGLSCVKLVKVEGLNITISGADILNGTPVLDIKPYLPYSDSFPDTATGWVKSGLENRYAVVFEQEAEKQAAQIKKNSKTNLKNYAQLQLEFFPGDLTRKRITQSDEKEKLYVLAYREYRLHYTINENTRTVSVQQITNPDNKSQAPNPK
jgi:tRNA-Thr(GGU) m(6)t(6)A37 methyltransferase TsaA